MVDDLRSIRDVAFNLSSIPPVLEKISKAKEELARSGHPKSLEWYLELSKVQEALAEKQTLTDFTQSFVTNLGRLRAAMVTQDGLRVKQFLEKYGKDDRHLAERLSQVIDLHDDIQILDELQGKSGINMPINELREIHSTHASTLGSASGYFLRLLSQK